MLPALLLAAGCGSSSSRSTSTATAVGGGVGGVAKCNADQIGKAVAGVGENENKTAVIANGSFRCADGWAVAQTLVGTEPNQTDETMVFEAEGQFWIPKNRATVCPNPSQVPKSLYDQACNSN